MYFLTEISEIVHHWSWLDLKGLLVHGVNNLIGTGYLLDLGIVWGFGPKSFIVPEHWLDLGTVRF